MKNKNKKLRFKLKLKNFGLTILKFIVLLITAFACVASIWFVSNISAFLSVISGMLSVFGYTLLTGKIENIKINNKHSINKLKINECSTRLSKDELELAKEAVKACKLLRINDSIVEMLNSSKKLKVINDATYNNKVMEFIKEVEDKKAIDTLPMYNYNDPIFKELEDKPKQKVLK